MNRTQKTEAQALSSHAGETTGTKFDLKRQPLHLAMFAGILLSYLLLLTKNYYWDGIFFAQVIEDAPNLNASLLHPNHLFYNVLGYLFYRAARNIGLEVRAIEVLQVLNCFISALCAYVFFRILLDCLKSIYFSTILTLLFAFSQTWWKFSTDADSYIISVFFLLVSFYLILPRRKPRPFLLTVAHALSMFFHQLAILFFPVIVLGILLQTSSLPAKQRLAPVLKYSLTAFLITVPIFYFSFYLVTESYAFKPFLQWITTFSPEHGFTFNFWDNLTYTLRGHSRLFAGGRLSFLRDLKNPFMFVLAGISLSLALLFFYKLIRYFRELKKADVPNARESKADFKSLRIICSIWIAVYLMFLFFFIPQNTFYRLFYLPAIIVLVGTFLVPYEATQNHVRRYRAALFVALMVVVNLTFSAYPYSQVRATPPLALSLELNKVWPQGTIVYFAGWNSDNQMVRYFNPKTVWREANQDRLEREMTNSQIGNGSIWIDTTLIDLYQATPEGRLWLDAHTIRQSEYELVNSKFRLQFYQIKLDSFGNLTKFLSP
jgi:hypothetical protein